ncbi:MAG: UDP-glucose/GDP-mannose dehydrogenase family protein [Deltaproteobacteria bacterium]|nr:UDP-glucose/GDP-mannose dehydrogenase family protein [Deltaproteobacteria bacterium]
MKVSVVGLGYVGAVSAACLARNGHHVIGCDIDPWKLDLLRAGRSPIVEEGMDDLVRSVVADGRLVVTDDLVDAVQRSTLTFICVGTPSLRGGAQDLGAVERVMAQMGQAIGRLSDRRHGCVLRSTVLPGTTDEVVIPILEANSNKKANVDFGVAFQPEFLREGSSIRDFDDPPYTVVGSEDHGLVESLQALFGDLTAEFIHVGVREAEALKLFSNAFHATKITFANEVGRICQASSVDPHAVMRLLCRDTQLNISPAYLRPGFAFGGSCLPKDVRALVQLGKDRDVDTPLFAGLLPSNRIQVERAIDLVLGLGCRSIGMLGLSFKRGTDDLRESPLVTLAETFMGKGLDLRIYDPGVQLSKLIGANRSYIERSIPHVASLMVPTLDAVVDHAEVLVLGQSDTELVRSLVGRLRPSQTVVDLVGLPSPERRALSAQYVGLCW